MSVQGNNQPMGELSHWWCSTVLVCLRAVGDKVGGMHVLLPRPQDRNPPSQSRNWQVGTQVFSPLLHTTDTCAGSYATINLWRCGRNPRSKAALAGSSCDAVCTSGSTVDERQEPGWGRKRGAWWAPPCNWAWWGPKGREGRWAPPRCNWAWWGPRERGTPTEGGVEGAKRPPWAPRKGGGWGVRWETGASIYHRDSTPKKCSLKRLL